jgi:hypothetical protein
LNKPHNANSLRYPAAFFDHTSHRATSCARRS